MLHRHRGDDASFSTETETKKERASERKKERVRKTRKERKTNSSVMVTTKNEKKKSLVHPFRHRHREGGASSSPFQIQRRATKTTSTFCTRCFRTNLSFSSLECHRSCAFFPLDRVFGPFFLHFSKKKILSQTIKKANLISFNHPRSDQCERAWQTIQTMRRCHRPSALRRGFFPQSKGSKVWRDAPGQT